MSGCGKLTVEPVLFLFMLSTFMQYTVFQDLIYEAVCSDNFNATVCKALHEKENRQSLAKVLEESSEWIMWSSISFSLPSILSTNLLGSWGDSYGRKLPLFLPSLGASVGTLVYVSASVLGTTSLTWIVVGCVLSGVTGGYVGCIMAVTSYTSEISNRGARTSRVSLLEASTFLAAAIGPAVGAQLSKAVNRDAVFTVCISCHVILVIYVALWLTDVPRSQSRHADIKWKELLGANHIIGAARTCFRYREDNRRANLVYLLICSLIIMTTTEGEMSQTFVYVHEDPPGWDLSTFGIYFALRSGIACLPLLFVGWLQPRENETPCTCISLPADRALCTVGLISKIAGLALLGIAHTDVPLFLVPPVSMLGFLCMPAIRSLLSKQVDPDELGKVFAFLAILQNLCLMLGSLAFNGLYPITRNIFRGLVFEIGASVLVIPLFIIMFDPLWKNSSVEYVNVQEPSAKEEEVKEEEIKEEEEG